MKLMSGEDWEPDETDIISWQRAYKNIDVHVELDAIACWTDANPKKRKTKKGVKRFVNAWLSRADKQGGSPLANDTQTEDGILPLRKWDATDLLTHDFMNNVAFREKMLKKHGRYMSFDGRRVYAK